MPKEEDEEDGLLTPKQLAELAELINNQLARHWLDDKRVQVVRLSVQGCDSTMRSLLGSTPSGGRLMFVKYGTVYLVNNTTGDTSGRMFSRFC